MSTRQQIPAHETAAKSIVCITKRHSEHKKNGYFQTVFHKHTPENELEHEVFTVEGEQSLEETERDHAQLQRYKRRKLLQTLTMD